MGFTDVIDYVPGKQGWFEENQPREGKTADQIWLGDVADDTVPTCGLRDRIGSIRQRVHSDGRDTCVVVNEQRIVLGLLRKQALDADPDAIVEDVMQVGPKTFRPDVTLEELVDSMRKHDIQTNSLVTTLDGRLLGVISRADAEATLVHEGAAEATR